MEIDNVTKGNPSKYVSADYTVPMFLLKEVTIVIVLIGFTLNLMIIIYFIKTKKYRSPIFTVLTSLAFMDMFTCLSTAGFAAFLFPTVVFDNVLFICPLFISTYASCVVASIYHLVLFAALRLYQMAWPLLAMSRVTSALMLKSCFCIITVSFSLSLWHGSWYWNTQIVNAGSEVTVCIFHGNLGARDIGDLVLITGLPCIAILFLQVIKHCVVSLSNVSSAMKQQRKTTDSRVVTIIIIVFYVCFLPQSTYAVLRMAKIDIFIKMADNIYLTLIYVEALNSVINPIVYCLIVKSVRTDIVRHIFSNICCT